MAKRTTYFSDAVETMIAPSESESFSGRVGFLVSAAHKLATDSCPALTSSEWACIADANNGTLHDYSQGSEAVISGMALNLFDCALDEKWGVDCTDLAKRLRSMTFAEQFAVFEIVRSFWLNGDVVSRSKTYRDAFEALGAQVK